MFTKYVKYEKYENCILSVIFLKLINIQFIVKFVLILFKMRYITDAFY